jgi:23S rRNA (uridine2552-2'-O)-methyltransferase
MPKRANPYERADRHTREARERGYPARSVVKLEDLDRRVKLLRGGMHVLDLGAAPGSWTRYAAERVGPSGRVLSVDLSPLAIEVPQNAVALQGDAFDLADEALATFAPYDVVLSDMAPATTGSKSTDAIRSAALVERAVAVADALAKPGSSFVAKLFMGSDYDAVRALVQERYASLRTLRPEGVRKQSVEVFLVAMERRG